LVITQEVVQMAEGLTYVQGEMEVSRGEEWSSKGMDGCPLKNTTSWLYHY
jgi:hypothetical protein